MARSESFASAVPSWDRTRSGLPAVGLDFGDAEVFERLCGFIAKPHTLAMRITPGALVHWRLREQLAAPPLGQNLALGADVLDFEAGASARLFELPGLLRTPLGVGALEGLAAYERGHRR